LGDSFGCTLLPLRYGISQQLERLSVGKWEVLNASVSGWSTRNQLAYLRCHAGKMNPHTVALLFFVGNDFSENIPGAKVEIFRGRKMFCSHEGSLIIHLLRKIKTFRVAETVSKHIMHGNTPVDSSFFTGGIAAVLHDSIPDETLVPSIPEKKFFRIQKRRLVNYRLSPSRRYLKGVQNTFNLIGEMRDFCRSRGWDFNVIILPAEIQVSLSLQQRVIEKYRLDLKKYDFLLPQKRIKGYLDSLNIPNLDIYTVFSNVPGDSTDKRIYRLLDTHFSRYGNRIAATAIHNWLATGLEEVNLPSR
jgi:hypothetical protein